MKIIMILFGSCLTLSALVYVVTAVLAAYSDIKSRPREAMTWCPRHGHFRKSHVLRLSSGAEICPQCYLDAITDKSGKVSLWRKK